ncbi:MAG: hypothetical protein COW30_05285 [Rhodospirillales bacterium CG15_BIG_FIL_POST_REV_8_21_14_020_66_15]|nr:MAG: hypothetical protein COW30_05285 [Rhodospirillales bacterium CG15_BIG_FIL_POST_REV_8_21_14_020_66_15]
MRVLIPVVLIGVAVVVQGCAGVGLTMLGVGGGTAASVGVNHTLSGISYKTFTASLPEVRRSTHVALKDMGIKVTDEKDVEGVRKIMGTAKQRIVEIELESLTPSTTRMRVTVMEEGGFFRDSSTATEIIIQAATALDTPMAADAAGGSVPSR